jgi:hypothetical protein
MTQMTNEIETPIGCGDAHTGPKRCVICVIPRRSLSAVNTETGGHRVQ